MLMHLPVLADPAAARGAVHLVELDGRELVVTLLRLGDRVQPQCGSEERAGPVTLVGTTEQPGVGYHRPGAAHHRAVVDAGVLGERVFGDLRERRARAATELGCHCGNPGNNSDVLIELLPGPYGFGFG